MTSRAKRYIWFCRNYNNLFAEEVRTVTLKQYWGDYTNEKEERKSSPKQNMQIKDWRDSKQVTWEWIILKGLQP